MTASLPDPPASSNKWLELISSAVSKGLVPFLLLIFVVWWTSKQAERAEARNDKATAELRADLKEARAETSKLIEKLIVRTESQTKEVTAAVKDVKAEVKAAAQPAAPVP